MSATLVQNSIEHAEEAIITLPNEQQPLLQSDASAIWEPPPAFYGLSLKLIEYSTAIMMNFFLGGFDSTITASTYAVISSEFNAANTAS
ncbi:Major facilitator superfamily domain general substrate transporter [Penicillium maclennaniae]|uniref:Major facilitator superfamily domain general substrate transporter n=1 Tax=Penicillium maclennaniae TaxID=1343394 RepID=UPI00254149B8|nr:Major facilitator superfamily domain general substrate transporter [Penicillium maclennaniae]KAJ5675270.1 Major facilitator superfamily domain general substrate transporter [Penicillium maclennaniae]